MKLTIEDKKPEKILRLYLEERSDGVSLFAHDGQLYRVLLYFSNDGTVKRVSNAEIGDFKFDIRGKIIID